VILYNIVTLLMFLLFSSVFQFRWLSIDVTLLVLWYLFITYRAALLCTLSILSMCCLVWGAQIEEQYSRFDLTMDLYARLLVSSCLICKFLRKKLKILLAFAVMLLMCVSLTYCLTKWYLNILQYLLTRVRDLWVYNWMHEVGVILLYLNNYIFADDTAYPMLIPRVLVYLRPFAEWHSLGGFLLFDIRNCFMTSYTVFLTSLLSISTKSWQLNK
jgi:hypothetical protein